jgi:hypothetical protein
MGSSWTSGSYSACSPFGTVSVSTDNLTNTLIIRIRADHREITLV